MEGKKLPAKDLVGPFLLPLHRLSKQEVGGYKSYENDQKSRL